MTTCFIDSRSDLRQFWESKAVPKRSFFVQGSCGAKGKEKEGERPSEGDVGD